MAGIWEGGGFRGWGFLVAAPASSAKIEPTVILDEDSDQRCSKEIQCGRKRKQSPPSLKTNEESVLEGQLF